MDKTDNEAVNQDWHALAACQGGMLTAVSGLYVSMYVLDLEERSCVAVKPDDRVVNQEAEHLLRQEDLHAILDSVSSPEAEHAMRAFLELETLPERLRDRRSVSEVLHAGGFGWCKAALVRMDGDEPARSVLYVVENVDKQMGRLEEQRDLAERNRELQDMIDALMDEYTSVCRADLATGEVEIFRLGGRVRGELELPNVIPPYAVLVDLYVSRAVHEDDRDMAREALDPDYIRERLRDGGSFAKVFRNNVGEFGEMKVVRIGGDTVLAGFTERDREIVEMNERLYTDSLTGAKNRRYYDEQIATRPCRALVMADIDSFKDINDEQGHQCGDDALAAVAAALRSCVRDSDDVVRYGGDEFLVAFGEISRDALLARAEDMRAAVEGIGLDRYPNVNLTMSIGAATGEGLVKDMVAIADGALYESKKRKNAVTVLPFP